MLVLGGEGGGAEDGDEEERVGGAGVGDPDGKGGGGGEAEGAVEGFGGGVPAVGGHHEEPVAAHGGLQIEAWVVEGQLQMHRAGAAVHSAAGRFFFPHFRYPTGRPHWPEEGY